MFYYTILEKKNITQQTCTRKMISWLKYSFRSGINLRSTGVAIAVVFVPICMTSFHFFVRHIFSGVCRQQSKVISITLKMRTAFEKTIKFEGKFFRTRTILISPKKLKNFEKKRKHCNLHKISFSYFLLNLFTITMVKTLQLIVFYYQFDNCEHLRGFLVFVLRRLKKRLAFGMGRKLFEIFRVLERKCPRFSLQYRLPSSSKSRGCHCIYFIFFGVSVLIVGTDIRDKNGYTTYLIVEQACSRKDYILVFSF